MESPNSTSSYSQPPVSALRQRSPSVDRESHDGIRRTMPRCGDSPREKRWRPDHGRDGFEGLSNGGGVESCLSGGNREMSREGQIRPSRVVRFRGEEECLDDARFVDGRMRERAASSDETAFNFQRKVIGSQPSMSSDGSGSGSGWRGGAARVIYQPNCAVTMFAVIEKIECPWDRKCR